MTLIVGMSSRAQQDVVKLFKLGNSRLLIATSVAEEGLDIKACNCVFRYNYSTNEIGRVQAKGAQYSTQYNTCHLLATTFTNTFHL